MLFGARCKFQGTSFQLPPRAAAESLFCRRFQRAVMGLVEVMTTVGGDVKEVGRRRRGRGEWCVGKEERHEGTQLRTMPTR